MKQALVIFAKAPQENCVKTRLVPPLTPAQATELYRCFLRDTYANVNQLQNASTIVAYTPAGTEHLFTELLPGCQLLLQEGEGFGPRLFGCFQSLFAQGYQSICVMDTDSPTLPHEVVARGFQALESARDTVVLGPSADGGYYLIGLNAPHPALFENISWSTSRVLAETVAQAQALGLQIERLPQWYDIDTEAELRILQRELEQQGTGGYGAPYTRAVLARYLAAPKPAVQTAAQQQAEA